MKPPQRLRLPPARFVTAAGAEAAPGQAWSRAEKRRLLAALRAQAGRELPEPRLLRERLPRRSEQEILLFLTRLRGRAAREAISTRYRHCLEQQRRRRAQLPAPIEVWLELAAVLGEGLEEASAAAFSQILTVAAVEPLTLRSSIPPQPPTLPDPGGAATPPDPSATPPRQPPEDPPGGGFSVSFPKLYEFLAELCRGGGGGAKGPLLPPAEAAVVLALLNSLPQELQRLNLGPLQSHFRGSYSALTAPRDPPGAPPATTQSLPSPAPGRTPPEGWGGVGLCPLNLFSVPLKLLARGGASG